MPISALLFALSCASTPIDSRPESVASELADVVGVSVSESGDSSTFSVMLLSPDTGCSQYADWWEVLTLDGALVSRRVLGHSHVDEQPFTRSGSLMVDPGQELWVRAHMNPGGYGGQAMRGSVAGGFVAAELDASFAAELASEQPLPDGCAF